MEILIFLSRKEFCSNSKYQMEESDYKYAYKCYNLVRDVIKALHIANGLIREIAFSKYFL